MGGLVAAGVADLSVKMSRSLENNSRAAADLL
jgi:hypothetical protein